MGRGKKIKLWYIYHSLNFIIYFHFSKQFC
nr:MAG TPA: Platelet-activating factor receptor protein-coupled receptor, Platelet-activating factor [Caudoviricetes sp.]